MGLRTYGEFTEYVGDMGVIAFCGKFVRGFPKLQDLTKEEQWHTGDPDTDPWQWKDRAAAERRLAFGCVLGGAKGFIAPQLYPLFYAANRPRYTVEERYLDGTVSQTLLDVSRLFAEGLRLSTADIRSRMRVTRKSGGSKVDSAVAALQKEYYLTVCGNSRKVGKDGREYGWPSNTYMRVEDWIPDWIGDGDRMDRESAREGILDHCDRWNMELDWDNLERLLFGGR